MYIGFLSSFLSFLRQGLCVSHAGPVTCDPTASALELFLIQPSLEWIEVGQRKNILLSIQDNLQIFPDIFKKYESNTSKNLQNEFSSNIYFPNSLERSLTSLFLTSARAQWKSNAQMKPRWLSCQHLFPHSNYFSFQHLAQCLAHSGHLIGTNIFRTGNLILYDSLNDQNFPFKELSKVTNSNHLVAY